VEKSLKAPKTKNFRECRNKMARKRGTKELEVDPEVHAELMKLKYELGLKRVSDVIRLLIERYRGG